MKAKDIPEDAVGSKRKEFLQSWVYELKGISQVSFAQLFQTSFKLGETTVRCFSEEYGQPSWSMEQDLASGLTVNEQKLVSQLKKFQGQEEITLTRVKSGGNKK